MDSGEPSSMGPAKRHKKGRTQKKKSGNEPTADKAPKEDVVRTAPESTTKWHMAYVSARSTDVTTRQVERTQD